MTFINFDEDEEQEAEELLNSLFPELISTDNYPFNIL